MKVEEKKGLKPTYELKILDQETGDTARIGVAWERESGFSIKLNPGVVLSYDGMKGKILSLFKIRTEEEWRAFNRSTAASVEPPPTKWRKENPGYVRKVHYGPFTKDECANRALGKAKTTDDPGEVTCRVCNFFVKNPNASRTPQGLKAINERAEDGLVSSDPEPSQS